MIVQKAIELEIHENQKCLGGNQNKITGQIYFMDPRPYHYEYRRPRLQNPTFQSLNLYESLYHKGLNKRYEISNSSSFQQSNPSFRENYENQTQRNIRNRQYAEKYAASFVQRKQPIKDHNMAKSVMLDSINPEYNRPNSNRSNQSNEWNRQQQKPSILASYGRNSMMDNHQKSRPSAQRNSQQKFRSSSGAYDRLNQFSIYQKQQKPYSIVGNYPRSTSIELKMYPKLTLQSKLIEEGRYLPPSV